MEVFISPEMHIMFVWKFMEKFAILMGNSSAKLRNFVARIQNFTTAALDLNKM